MNPNCSSCSFLNLAILRSKRPRIPERPNVYEYRVYIPYTHTYTHTRACAHKLMYPCTSATRPRRNAKRRSRIIFISTWGDMRVGVGVGGRNNTNTPRGRYAVIKNSPRLPGWFVHATLPQETHAQVARTLAFRWCDRSGQLYFSYISHRAVYIID